MKRKSFNIIFALVLAMSLSLAVAVPASADVDAVTPAAGGDAISADTAAGAPGAAWTDLGAITISEGASGDIAVGDFTMTIPAGFEFNTASVPDVAVTGTTPQLAANSPAAITATTITVTVTAASTSETDNDLIIGGVTPIQVRPTGGTPLAAGNINMTAGTIAGVTGATNFGTLTEVHGALDAYTVIPDAALETVGTPFNVVINAVDQFGSPLGGDYVADAPYTWETNGSNAADGTEPDLSAPLVAGDFIAGVATKAVTLVYAEAGVTFTITDDSGITGNSAANAVLVQGINLDKAFYDIGEDVEVTVCDDSANGDHVRRDTIEVNATSDSDPMGIDVTLTETGVNTGIFTSTFPLVPTDPEPGAGELAVADSDTITVAYGGFPDAMAVVDTTPPEFDADTTADAAFYKNGDTITLTVDLDAAGYTVSADFSDIDSEYTEGDEDVTGGGAPNNIYTITYVISEDNTTADGEYTIPVTAEDGAGNSAVDDSCSANLDNTEPTVEDAAADPPVLQPGEDYDVTFTVSVSDDGAGIGTVTIDLSEVGGDADQAMFDDGLNGGDAEDDDGIYTFLLADVNIADEASYALPITATDAVDNTNDTVEITLQVTADTDPPIISDASVEYPVGFESAKPGNDVVITAVVTDELTNVEEVTIDATDIGLGDAIAMTLDDVADTYSVTLIVGDVDPGTYSLTITATDSAGNPATEDVDVVVAGALTAYNLALAEGWNLFSLPLIPDDEAIETIFADIIDSVEQVRTWVYEDGVLTEKVWAEGGAVGELTNMEDGQGYWVETIEAIDMFTIFGIELPTPPETPPAYAVHEGWNLIGFKSVDERTMLDYVGGAVSVIFERMYGYDADGLFYVVINLDTNLEPGQGYWLAVSGNGTIYP